jgi:hypothetical protein
VRRVVLIALLALAGCGADPPKSVTVYAPTQGTIDTFIVAAKRWNESGANVRITVVARRRDADVVVTRDDARLRALCNERCFGLTVGDEILYRESLDHLTPLGVWIAVHELGHVLGLEHDRRSTCTVMSPHWYDTRCAPTMSDRRGSVFDPRCAPAPVDVEAAIRLHGGEVAARDPYCSAA